MGADAIEMSVYGMVVAFLRSPDGVESEMRRRHEISAESEASLIKELASLERQRLEEQEAEARAFRLASRGTVSDEVFNQEIGLIRTRQRWIGEQKERGEQQISEIRRYAFDPQSVEILRRRLEARLETANPEDRRFILEAVGTRVLVQSDGTWELELQVPREVPEIETDSHVGVLQTLNDGPESNSTIDNV